MSRVNAIYAITHPNDATPATQTGLHVGNDGMAQMLLNERDTQWMQNMSPGAVLGQLAKQEERRGSIVYLYGHESNVMLLLFLCILFIAALLVLRILYLCAARALWRSKQQA